MESTAIQGVSETLFIPLLGRASAQQFYPQIRLHDPLAESLIANINYDFGHISQDRRALFGLAKRAEVLDKICRKFFASYPNCSVLSLGSGLSTQFYRVDNGHIHWHDIDFAPVIDLRRSLLPAHPRLFNHALSALDFAGLDKLIGNSEPSLILCEGLLMYFKESEAQELLSFLCEKLPAKSLIVFDAFHSKIIGREYLVPSLKKSQAKFQWGMRSLRHAESWHPKLKYLSNHLFVDFYKFRYRIIGAITRSILGAPVYSIYRYEVQANQNS